jgi:hypothetical protein
MTPLLEAKATGMPTAQSMPFLFAGKQKCGDADEKVPTR